MDDNEIIGLYFARSEEAIARTEEKYGSFCRGVARNILGSPEDAEECADDAYLALWNSIPPQRPEHFKAYLGKIARNIALNRYERDHAAKRGAPAELVLDEIAELVADPCSENTDVDEGRISAEIDRFLTSLPTQERVIFVRRYFYLCPIRTIAADMALGESKVKMTLFRTRKKLRSHLEKNGVSL